MYSMKKTVLCLLLAFTSQSVFLVANAADDKPITVNGVTLPSALVERSVNLNVQQGKKDTPELRQLIKEEFINREVVAQQAAKLGLDKTPDGQAAFAEMKRNFLVELFLADYDKTNPITDAAIKAEYDKQIAAIGDQAQEYKLSHIVTKTEADARALLARIKKGETFAKVAKEASIDPSAKDSGALGWLLPNQIIPAVANVIVNLTEGSVSAAPIQTAGGWQLVRLEEKRPFKAPKIEDVTPQLRATLQQQQRIDAIKKLRSSAKVTGNM
jgi:peptidyl-prolyl cis-trans isomerase C